MAVLTVEPDFTIVSEAGTIADTFRNVKRVHPDLLLLDHRFPDGEGIDACVDLLRAQPSLRILILTLFDTPELARRALDAGAHGFVTKSGEPHRLVTAIRQVLDGQRTSDVDTSGKPLTEQELEVLSLVVHGHTNAGIGERLGISAETVKIHVRNITTKLCATNRTEAAAIAIAEGIVRHSKAGQYSQIP